MRFVRFRVKHAFLLFRVSRKLKDNLDNGEDYFRLQGSTIWLPRDSDNRPNREFSSGIRILCFGARSEVL